ncbi:hypothetical protein AHiyo6_20090, partial [Arthrobacter sp. Hiyo6]
FVGSLAARLRDRHRLGVRLARLGAVLLISGGFLGGYMASSRRAPRVPTDSHLRSSFAGFATLSASQLGQVRGVRRTRYW